MGNLSQQRVSYGELCSKQRASLVEPKIPRPTETAKSSKPYESPEYLPPTPGEVVYHEVSPEPSPSSEASHPAELVEMVDYVNNLPLPKH